MSSNATILISVTSDNQYIVAVSNGNNIVIIEISSGKIVKEIKGDAFIYSLATSPDNQYLFAPVSGVMHQINLNDFRIEKKFPQYNYALSLKFSHDSKYVGFVPSSDREVIVLDVNSGQEVLHLDYFYHSTAFAFFPQSQRLIAGDIDGDAYVKEIFSESVFKNEKDPLLGKTISSLNLGEEALHNLAVSNDEKILYAWRTGDLEVWDLEDKTLIERLIEYDEELDEFHATQGILSMSNKYLVSGGAEGDVYVFNATQRDLIYKSREHDTEVRGLAITPDDKYLITSDVSGDTIIWNLADGTIFRRFNRNFS